MRERKSEGEKKGEREEKEGMRCYLRDPSSFSGNIGSFFQLGIYAFFVVIDMLFILLMLQTKFKYRFQ